KGPIAFTTLYQEHDVSGLRDKCKRLVGTKRVKELRHSKISAPECLIARLFTISGRSRAPIGSSSTYICGWTCACFKRRTKSTQSTPMKDAKYHTRRGRRLASGAFALLASLSIAS